MAHGHPKFDAPPIVEMVLSVQFARLPGYSTAHAGWFWKEYLEKLEEDSSRKWSQAADAPRLEDAFERFGAEDIWVPPISMKLLGQAHPQRSQFIRSDGDRMIQVQDTRFILNWKKQSAAYPSYDSLLAEFRTLLHAFESFCREAGFGPLQYNQWEITYVDQLKKGDSWESARDLARVFPVLSIPPLNPQLLSAGDETVSADWRLSLAQRRGRIYISARQVRTQPLGTDEFLNVTLTGRGPVSGTQTWEQGLEIGHDALGETFVAITSTEAHELWRRRA